MYAVFGLGITLCTAMTHEAVPLLSAGNDAVQHRMLGGPARAGSALAGVPGAVRLSFGSRSGRRRAGGALRFRTCPGGAPRGRPEKSGWRMHGGHRGMIVCLASGRERASGTVLTVPSGGPHRIRIPLPAGGSCRRRDVRLHRKMGFCRLDLCPPVRCSRWWSEPAGSDLRCHGNALRAGGAG